MIKLSLKAYSTLAWLIIGATVATGLILLTSVFAAISITGISVDDDSLRVSDSTAEGGSFIEFSQDSESTTPPDGQIDGATYIAPTANTSVPVYDTGWQMMVMNTPEQLDPYFRTLKEYGFTGSWMGLLHHLPATINYNGNGAYAGTPGSFDANSVRLNQPYIDHVNRVLDVADSHGMKIGLIPAWQDVYLPYESGWKVPEGNQPWTGIVDEQRACEYGKQLAREFGDHPAAGMWVMGGDGGENATLRVRDIYKDMARCMKEEGSTLAVTFHTGTKTWTGGNPVINYPPSNPTRFDGQLFLAEDNESEWLSFVGVETGHNQGADKTGAELREAVNVYEVDVWAGEPRYYNITCCGGSNPGANEMRADAQAAKNAGVSGYVYGDAGRWTACFAQTNLDSTPCNPNDYAASFGPGERAVIEVFRE